VQDLRVERLADLIVGYALGLGEGDVLRIDGFDVAAPLALAVYRAAIRVGAHPYANLEPSGLSELLVTEGSDEQLEYISPTQWHEVETLDAMLTIWSEENTRSFSRVDERRHGMLIATRRKLANRRWERISAGELRWCGTLHPTNAHAQDASMSLAEYERFFFGACHTDEEAPAEFWRSFSATLTARAEDLATTRELRILGPDTDLRLVVDGRTWLAADGRRNMPDGEVFTSPVETGTEGGRVVDAEAAQGGAYLRELLDLDEGARVVGELAFGLNYEIDRFTRNILLDEKIGGTMHLALGSGFAQTGGKNVSGLHWDLICDLREEGEVYADGELVWKAGAFLREPEPATATVGSDG